MWTWTVDLNSMGQTVTTLLNLTLKHWAEVRFRAHYISVEMKKHRWDTLCALEWPSFEVRWLAAGSLSWTLIQSVKQHVFGVGPRSHPDQILYILVLEDLVSSKLLHGFVRGCLSLLYRT